jgi:hypothetical protein
VRKYWFIYLLILLAVTSCQRVIDININPGSTLLVIEGNVVNVAGVQTVTISKTVPYNDANVYPSVSGANVTITTNGTTYILKETQPGQYTVSNMKVRTSQEYSLTVKSGDKVYTSSSLMPAQVLLDSVGITTLDIGNKTVKTVSTFYHDPPGIVNQYRFVMYVNGLQVKQIFALSDQLTNGRIVNTMLYQDDIVLRTGDKVDIEMQCIDNNVYNYWFTLSQQGGNGPNNSATPSNPISNLTNGALGYFSAHTVQKKSITVL